MAFESFEISRVDITILIKILIAFVMIHVQLLIDETDQILITECFYVILFL